MMPVEEMRRKLSGLANAVAHPGLGSLPAAAQSAVSTAAGRLLDVATPVTVLGQLQALALAIQLRPSLRHHLRPGPGREAAAFQAGFQFCTGDGLELNLRLERGRARVGLGRLPRPDVTVRFRSRSHLRSFFAGGDVFGMLLENQLSFEGNLSYLSRLGYLSAAARQLGARPRAPSKPAGDWRTLPSPPSGEPCPEPPPAEEVRWLEDASLAAYRLDDFPRIKRLLWAFRETPPAVCTERARLLTRFIRGERPGGGDPPVLRQARALAAILDGKQAIVHDDDVLLGTTTSQRIGVVIYPELGGTGLWPELLSLETRQLNPYRIGDEDIAILDREVFPFWTDNNLREWAKRENGHPQCLQLDERFVLYFMWKTQAVSHTIADMPAVLRRGLADIRAEALRRREAASGEQRAFYEALAIALQAVIGYSERLAARARQLAAALPADGATTAARRAELLEMARVCEKVPARPAESVQEALQAIWTVFLCLHQESTNAGLSVGRLDVWLQPFLDRELREIADPTERRRRIERVLELTCAFMLKLTDHLPMVPDIGNRLFGGSSSDQVITLGGLTREGRSAVSDMTFILLKATEMLRLRDPNMNARYAPGVNSRAYLRRLCEVNRLTRATPSLHNDAAVVASLQAQGFAPEDARDWGATGCVEPTSCGRHYGHTNCMMLNLVAPLEMMLHDGVHPLVGQQLGPRTGNPRAFRSYQELLDAYLSQLGWLIDKSVEANNLLGRAHQRCKPTPLLSALIEGPMESGRDLIEGGARYNSSGAALIGLTDVVDSLSAMHTLVFERGEFSMGTLLDAVEADFEGFPEVLLAIRERVPRFGQDAELPRSIARQLMDFAFERYQAHRNYRGGRYVPGYWSMSNHVAFGILSGALPSGRRRGQPFTPGLTPSAMAQAPLTSQIRAVAGLDPLKLPNNIAFNCKLVPGAADSARQVVDRMAAYVESYFELGGMQIQFNVVSTATLREAMERPEEYRDLLVRISGYNAYFVELNRDMQLELIERMEHPV